MSLTLPNPPTLQGPSFPPLGPRPKVLMVWPRVPPSFWSWEGSKTIRGIKASMPPLGLITVAALCPRDWEVCLVDQAVEELTDAMILWSDLVMVSSMYVQRKATHEVLERARRLGKRTIIGGSYPSSEPDTLLEVADHVVVGEPDEVFDEIASGLEKGTARRMYVIEEKPDVTALPVPRFDLLQLDSYAAMPIQFSRGCPFQCEFCDIITIYGRKPRTKTPEQIVGELDRLYELGWRSEIFLVDDNFIGNRKKALDLVRRLHVWQRERGYPFPFYTEASIDLARCRDLIDAMVAANFFYVFIGIESPSRESLEETKKFQNLRGSLVDSLHLIQSRGLWVTGGFIVGFDSDAEDIFDRQVELINETAIPWAMVGFLQALPTTPLFDRIVKEGRLLPESDAISNFSLPNFLTRMPLPVLVEGYRRMLSTLYEPRAFYDRAFRSLCCWKTRDPQQPPRLRVCTIVGIFTRSIWYQGLVSGYRRAYWSFFWKLLYRFGRDPRKLWLGSFLLVSAHHFVSYAATIVRELRHEMPRTSHNDRNLFLRDRRPELKVTSANYEPPPPSTLARG